MDYRERYSDAAPSVQALADATFVDPIFTVSEAADLVDMTYPAANTAVDRLDADGLLEEHTGQERYREFQATDVLEILNRDRTEIPKSGDLLIE
jgi:DNA-binding MarR family transcriptional regulator